jgi:hypothetical protein
MLSACAATMSSSAMIQGDNTAVAQQRMSWEPHAQSANLAECMRGKTTMEKVGGPEASRSVVTMTTQR